MESMGVTAHDGGFALATAGSVFINVWREPSTLAQLELLREHEAALVEHEAAGVIMVLTVLLPSAFTLGTRERKEVDALARQFAPSTRAHAYVIEGSGFRTAAVRALVAGINLITRTGGLTKVFEDTVHAAEWLEAVAAPEQVVRANEVMRAVAEARATFGPAAATS
jgi:hypothetical protein